MLIKQLSMFSSWCTNMIIISTLSTESIKRITSKCLTECFQCHQEKFCLRSQSLSLLPIHLPLSSRCSAFFSSSEHLLSCFWHPALHFFKFHQPLFPIHPHSLSLNTRGTNRVMFFLRLLHQKREVLFKTPYKYN